MLYEVLFCPSQEDAQVETNRKEKSIFT